MSRLPRTALDEEVEASIARYPLGLKRALNRLAVHAIDSTHEERRAVQHYLDGISRLDNVPAEVSSFLRQALSVSKAVSARSAGQVLHDKGVTSSRKPGEEDGAGS